MFPTRKITTTGGDVFRDDFSLAFDGTDDFIDLGSQSGDLRLSGSNGAIVAWIKPTLTGDEFQRIVDKSSSGSGANGYALFIKKDGNVTGNIDGVAIVTTPTGVVAADKWQHLVWTWNGTTHYVYVDGIEVQSSSSSTTPPSNTTNMRIGTWNHDVAREYRGNMSEVVIYNKGLSASEVKTLYNGREPYNHKEGVCLSNLLAWWRMGDGALDSKQNTNANTGIVSDETNPTFGTDLLGGKGDFSDASYWQIHSGQSIVEDDVGKFLGNGSYNAINKAGILTVGKMYRCQIDCTSNSGTSITLNQSTYYPQIVTIGLTGTHFAFFQAGVTNFTMYAPTNSYGETAIIDNVIVQEVNGNAGALKNIATKSCFKGDTP
tara:strand:- start:343 stop:1467 length:1125 start_codon:yes stop_codon:yes gene_type:complete